MKDIKEAVAKPRKVALYAATDIDDYCTVMPVNLVSYDEHYASLPEGQEREKSYDKFVRISEIVELRFSPLTDEGIIQKAIESIDETERRLREELNKKIAELRQQKAQLLALTHEVTA